MNGFLIINKQKNMTSNDVVYHAKRKLGIKKIGHSGTLDPDTTGVVVLAINRATRFLPILTEDSQKTYIAKAKLGIATDTMDISGKIIDQKPVLVNKEDVELKLNEFTKTYDQVPPIYSAKKVNGKRLYEYARKDAVVEIKPSTVTIHNTKLIDFSGDEFEFEVTVSKGTYIRSLIYDIAVSLGTVATMTDLVRTKTDGFDLSQSIELEEIDSDKIISLEDYISDKYPVYEVYGKICKLIQNGALLRYRDEFVYPCVYVDSESGKCLAIYDRFDDNVKPIMMF